MTIAADRAAHRPEPPRLLLPRAQRRVAGFWVSLGLHALLLALLWTRRDLLLATPEPGDPRFGSAGGGGGGGGGGGNRTTYIIALPPSPPPPAIPALPVPPVTIPPSVQKPAVTTASTPAVTDSTPAVPAVSATPGAGTSPGQGEGAGANGGSGGGTGGGAGSGSGVGSGPGSGGQGGSIRPPELRGLSIPFSTPPRELRGRTVKVMFAIAADGKVERFDTDPVITDRGYYKKFSDVVMGFRFKPARGPDGQPVPVVFPMEFTLPTQ